MDPSKRSRTGIDLASGEGSRATTVIDTWRSESLPDQAKVLESVIECLPDGVIVADRSGTFLIFNAAARQILGRGPQDVPPADWVRTYGYHLPDGVTPYPSDQLPLARALRGEEVQNAEIFIRNERVPDGRWINASAMPWRDESGVTHGALVIFRDVSDKKKSLELNERLSNVVEQSERHQVQLDAAHVIQQRLYPKEAPQTPGFDIAGAAYPAESLCGDYYDFFPMPGGCLGMTIADVCGHGLGPSILMAQARAYLRSLALTHADVGEVLRRLNEILTVEGSEREFVTQILVRLDPDARTLVYTNAGHPPGFLLDQGGEVREELRACNLPLGLYADRLYPSSRAIRLEPGDLLVLFTDGITECSGRAGGEFGNEGVLEIVRRHRRDPARRILDALYEAASGFRFKGPQLDDMTAIVCKHEG